MKALSLHQPWAHLIAEGRKTIETRTWRTFYHGRLLICSTKNTSEIGQAYRARYPLGVTICVANLVDCRPLVPADEDAACTVWSPGRWAWVLENVHKVENLPIRGFPGLFQIPREIRDRLRELKAGATWCADCGVLLSGHTVIKIGNTPTTRCITCDPDSLRAALIRRNGWEGP